jgi:hypothetical protein
MRHVGRRGDPKDIASQDQLGDFTIIYPNGGSAVSPANVTANSRYVSPNPFPGFAVICILELFYLGEWGAPGFAYAGGGYGALASQFGANIVTQTGGLAVLGGSNNTGNPFNTTVNPTALPCRVKVWKAKGAIA